MSDQNTQLIESLYDLGAHLGYSRSRRHTSVVKYLYGMKNRIDIIDLESTAKAILEAKTFIESVKSTGKNILLVGTKAEISDIIRRTADIANIPFVSNRWIGGTLTNWAQIRTRIDKMKKLKSSSTEGTLVYATKKEKLMLEREIEKLESKFSGLESLEAVPGAIIIVDPRKEHICLEEAVIKKIPVVAIANTDCDIRKISYPIIANDANAMAIHYILSQLLSNLK